MAERITDHVAAALARLAQQLKDKPNIEAIFTALLGPTQSIEDVLYQLLTERTIDTAVGAQLDALGTLVGQPRNGMVDEDYRRLVRARIARNNSDGLVEDLIVVTRLIIDNTDFTIEADQEPIASVAMRVFGIEMDPDLAELLISFLRDTVSAGVRIVLETLTAPLADSFVWDGTADQSWDNGAFATARE